MKVIHCVAVLQTLVVATAPARAAEGNPFDAEVLDDRPRVFLRTEPFQGLTIEKLRHRIDEPEYAGVSDKAEGYLQTFREFGVDEYFKAYAWVDGAATGATYTLYYTYTALPTICAAWWSATDHNPADWIRAEQGEWLDGIIRHTHTDDFLERVNSRRDHGTHPAKGDVPDGQTRTDRIDRRRCDDKPGCAGVVRRDSLTAILLELVANSSVVLATRLQAGWKEL